MVTTQSVPDFVAASSRYSFINVLCISAALTASMPVAKAYVVAVVPLKTSVCGGLASVRSGSVTPGANQIGPAGERTHRAERRRRRGVTSSATAGR